MTAVGAELHSRQRASGAPGIRGGAPYHQPQLDGVRGLAILGVLLCHAVGIIQAVQYTPSTGRLLELMSLGWGGVDLFFTLSGFLITGILLRGRHAQGYFTSFYARRILRIFPIYYLFLVASLLLCTQVPTLARLMAGSLAHLPPTVAQRFSYFLYLQNLPWFWSGPLALGMTGLWGSFWSLAVEEQFYFVWPALVRYLNLALLYWFCILALIACPILRAYVAHRTGNGLGLLQFPTSRLDGLFAGAALALYRERRGKPLSLGWSYCWLAAGVGILLWIAGLHEPELLHPGFFFGRIGVTGFALASLGLIALTQHPVAGLGPVLTGAPLRFLGKYSYGIYVYHLAIFLLFHHLRSCVSTLPHKLLARTAQCSYDLLAIALSLAVAWLSYRYLESPLLTLKRFFPSPAQHRTSPVGRPARRTLREACGSATSAAPSTPLIEDTSPSPGLPGTTSSSTAFSSRPPLASH